MPSTNSRSGIPPLLFFPRVTAKLIGCFLLICASASLQAQVETGKIVGSAKDASGAVVAEAAVTATEIQTSVVKKTRTNTDGEYVISDLNAGEYTVAVERAGFKKAVQSAFPLHVNQVVRVDFVLTVGT